MFTVCCFFLDCRLPLGKTKAITGKKESNPQNDPRMLIIACKRKNKTAQSILRAKADLPIPKHFYSEVSPVVLPSDKSLHEQRGGILCQSWKKKGCMLAWSFI